MVIEMAALSNKEMRLHDCSNKIFLSLDQLNPTPRLNRIQVSSYNNNHSTNHLFLSTDKTIKLFKFSINSFELVNTFEGHTRSVSCLEICNNQTLISGSNDCTIKCWQIHDAMCSLTLRGHEGSVHGICLLKSCGYLLSISFDDTMRLWDLDLGICIRIISNLTCAYLCVAQSLNNGHLFFGTNLKTIQIWDMDNRENLLTKSLIGHEGFVSVVEVLNEKLISGSKDYTIKIWSLDTGKCEKTLRGHAGIVTFLKSLSKLEMASSAEDKTIKIWCLKHFVCLKTLSLSENIGCLELTPMGQLISCSSNYFKIWMLNNNDEHKSFNVSSNLANYKPVSKVFYL